MLEDTFNRSCLQQVCPKYTLMLKHACTVFFCLFFLSFKCPTLRADSVGNPQGRGPSPIKKAKKVEKCPSVPSALPHSLGVRRRAKPTPCRLGVVGRELLFKHSGCRVAFRASAVECVFSLNSSADKQSRWRTPTDGTKKEYEGADPRNCRTDTQDAALLWWFLFVIIKLEEINK